MAQSSSHQSILAPSLPGPDAAVISSLIKAASIHASGNGGMGMDGFVMHSTVNSFAMTIAISAIRVEASCTDHLERLRPVPSAYQ